MAQQLLFLNGRRFSHSSLEITIQKSTGAAEIFIDVDSIDYGDGLELALVRGTNRAPIGITAGDYTAEDCNLSMGKSTFQIGLVQAIGHGWMGSNVQVTVSYNDQGEPLCTDVIKGVLAGATDASAVGPDPNKVKVRVLAQYVQRNGVLPLKNMLV